MKLFASFLIPINCIFSYMTTQAGEFKTYLRPILNVEQQNNFKNVFDQIFEIKHKPEFVVEQDTKDERGRSIFDPRRIFSNRSEALVAPLTESETNLFAHKKSSSAKNLLYRGNSVSSFMYELYRYEQGAHRDQRQKLPRFFQDRLKIRRKDKLSYRYLLVVFPWSKVG